MALTQDDLNNIVQSLLEADVSFYAISGEIVGEDELIEGEDLSLEFLPTENETVSQMLLRVGLSAVESLTNQAEITAAIAVVDGNVDQSLTNDATIIAQTTAAAIRTATGLAAANLDTQLTGIATEATTAATEATAAHADAATAATEIGKVQRSASPVVAGEAVEVERNKIAASADQLREFYTVR